MYYKFKKVYHFFEINKKWLYVLSLLIVITLLYKTYLFKLTHFSQILPTIQNHPLHQWIGISIILFVLMFVNYFFETKKIQSLLSTNNTFSIKDILRSTFIGTSSSILSPNRSAEFIGRNTVLYGNIINLNGLFISFYASVIQQFITCMVAMFSFIILFYQYQLIYHKVIVLLSFMVSILLLVIFLIPSKLLLKLVSKSFRNTYLISKISFKQKIQALLFGLLRYLIFTLQLLLLIYFINEGYFNSLQVVCLIAIYYFITTYVPSSVFTDAIIRYGIAVSIFANVGASVAVIIIWFINIFVPVLIGLVLLWRHKIKAVAV